MPASDTHPLICPECGADVPPGAQFCPDCHALLANARDRKPEPPARDTVIEKDLLQKFEEQRSREEALRKPKRSGGQKVARGPKPLGKAEPAELKMVSAELIVPGKGEKPKRPAANQQAPSKERPPAKARPRKPAPVSTEGMDVEPPRRAEPAPEPPPPGANLPARRPNKALAPKTDRVPRGTTGRTIALIASELEDALDSSLRGWANMDLADKLSALAIGGLLVSTLLPWYHTNMGILTGGALLWLFAIGTAAVIIVRRRMLAKQHDDSLDDSLSERVDPAALRRLNLLQILAGVGAVLYLMLLVFALYLSDPKRFELAFGWFVALFFTMGLAYSGIARFIRDVKK